MPSNCFALCSGQVPLYRHRSSWLTTIYSARNATLRLETGASEWLKSNWFEEFPQVPDTSFTNPIRSLVNEEYQSLVQPKWPELLEDVVDRYNRTIDQLIAAAQGQDLIVVTHGFGVSFMCQHLVPDTLIYETPYACLTKLSRATVNEPWKVDFVSDDSHASSL